MLTWQNSKTRTLCAVCNEKECSANVSPIMFLAFYIQSKEWLAYRYPQCRNLLIWHSYFSSLGTVSHIQGNVDFLLHKQNHSLRWPGNSPDLNPTENLWSNIKQRLWGKGCTTKQRLISNRYFIQALQLLINAKTYGPNAKIYSGGAKTQKVPDLDQNPGIRLN